MQGAWCDGDGRLATVVPMQPIELRNGSLAVEVVLTQETRRLDVRPVEPRWF